MPHLAAVSFFKVDEVWRGGNDINPEAIIIIDEESHQFNFLNKKLLSAKNYILMT